MACPALLSIVLVIFALQLLSAGAEYQRAALISASAKHAIRIAPFTIAATSRAEKEAGWR